MKRISKTTLFVSLVVCNLALAEQTCLVETDASNRYINHQDGTITDVSTGLRWTLCVAGQNYIEGECRGTPEQLHLNTALTDAQTLSVAEIGNWRVPNITELRSLLNLDCANPAMDIMPFQAGQTDLSHLSGRYTTSTFHESWGGTAYRTVNFATGEQHYSDTEVNSTYEDDKRYVRYVTDARD